MCEFYVSCGVHGVQVVGEVLCLSFFLIFSSMSSAYLIHRDGLQCMGADLMALVSRSSVKKPLMIAN